MPFVVLIDAQQYNNIQAVPPKINKLNAVRQTEMCCTQKKNIYAASKMKFSLLLFRRNQRN